ncbi:YigZ family protein [Eubacterium ventriosum]|uniref:YigZ family protein n=1 Tax=Eubacterium ventriosum TaxID=39496 RepID=UPI0026724C0D|nr:YigZ family protein [Eubacterium ventriosum]
MEKFIIKEGGQGEIVEKKSRFIATVLPIDTEEEALQYIEKIKKKYWDARHNCFAFVIGSNNEIQRFSDDGEPQGTAGKPILETLLNENLHNTLIVVTRYFGGTLLGTGGLVRAYGQSSKEGIRNSVIQKVCEGISFKLTVDYNSIGKIKYIMGQMGITDAREEYGQNVVLSILMKKDEYNEFNTKVTDATGGKAVFEDEEDREYKEEVKEK